MVYMKLDGKITKLKPRRDVKKNNKTHPAAPIPIGDNDSLYEVEKVLDSKVGEFGTVYLVKWAGYTAVYNSWIVDLPSFFHKYKAEYMKGIFDSKGKGSCIGHEESGDESGDESDYMPEYDTDGYSDSGSDGYSDDDHEEGMGGGSILGSYSQMSDKVKDDKSKNDKSKKKKKKKTTLYTEKSVTKKQEEKKSKKQKMVSKALLALAAVVAAGVSDMDSDSDE